MHKKLKLIAMVLLIITVAHLLVSCNQPIPGEFSEETKQEIKLDQMPNFQVQYLGEVGIYGAYKVTVDSLEYVVIERYTSVAITKHK